jgi:mRNA deadenylase 3'-5' endonuclease subunit Ccr4/uncharacterized protein with PIN domain
MGGLFHHAGCRSESCWVRSFPEWVTVEGEGEDETGKYCTGLRVRVATFNVLAGNYSHPRSFPSVLPKHLDFKDRLRKLKGVIQRLCQNDVDFLCLQECDYFEKEWREFIVGLGFSCLHQKRPTKEDGCLIAWNSSRWELRRKERVSFDRQTPELLSKHQLQRHNVALLVALRRIGSEQTCLLVNTHLFWNPEREDVKLLQAALLSREIVRFRLAMPGVDMPLIVCGDFNSTPAGAPMELLLKGQAASKGHARGKGKDGEAVEERCPSFMLDMTLNRLCRYMRLLGFDAALETSSEHEERVHGNLAIVDRSKREGRVLLTSSKNLAQRRACSAVDTLLLDTSRTAEEQLADVCRLYRLSPRPEALLTRCVKCNGGIHEVNSEEERTVLIEMDIVPDIRSVIEKKTELYACSKCHQPYWWPESASSNASRALQKAKDLQTLAELAAKEAPLGVDELALSEQVMGMISDLDLAFKVLRGDPLTQPLSLKSAYAAEALATNITVGFIGQLDYILTESARVLAIAKLPAVSHEIRSPYLPDRCWPSDHLCLVAEVLLGNG